VIRIGDIVRIRHVACSMWPDAAGQIGIIIAESPRGFIPAWRVLILGEIAQFDVEEMEKPK